MLYMESPDCTRWVWQMTAEAGRCGRRRRRQNACWVLGGCGAVQHTCRPARARCSAAQPCGTHSPSSLSSTAQAVLAPRRTASRRAAARIRRGGGGRGGRSDGAGRAAASRAGAGEGTRALHAAGAMETENGLKTCAGRVRQLAPAPRLQAARRAQRPVTAGPGRQAVAGSGASPADCRLRARRLCMARWATG